MTPCTVESPVIVSVEHQEVSFEFPCESGTETFYHMIGRTAAGRRYAYSRHTVSLGDTIVCDEADQFRELPREP